MKYFFRLSASFRMSFRLILKKILFCKHGYTFKNGVEGLSDEAYYQLDSPKIRLTISVTRSEGQFYDMVSSVGFVGSVSYVVSMGFGFYLLCGFYGLHQFCGFSGFCGCCGF